MWVRSCYVDLVAVLAATVARLVELDFVVVLGVSDARDLRLQVGSLLLGGQPFGVLLVLVVADGALRPLEARVQLAQLPRVALNVLGQFLDRLLGGMAGRPPACAGEFAFDRIRPAELGRVPGDVCDHGAHCVHAGALLPLHVVAEVC
jgi:hypothetical protein